MCAKTGKNMADQDEEQSKDGDLTPKHVDVSFVFDDASESLLADLYHVKTDPKLNLLVLQKLLRSNDFAAFEVSTDILQEILRRASEDITGKLKIAKKSKSKFTDFQLSLDTKTKKIIASLTSGISNTDVDLNSLKEYIKNHDLEKFYYRENTLEKLLERIMNHERGTFEVAEQRDADLSIDISKDEMTATMTTSPSFGGISLSMGRIMLALKKKGIDYKICSQPALDKILREDSVENHMFAQGIKSIDGEDTRFKALLSSTDEHAPASDGTGKVDLLQIKDFRNVLPGEPVMKRIPATQGKNGCDVLGHSVPAKVGVEKSFSRKSLGVDIDTNNANILIANKRGYPVIFEDGVRVEDILILDNVDLHSGNISYDGSVLISGKISPGMIIHVTGDVLVKDTINNATIIAGNDIVIDGGIMGSDVKDNTPDKEQGANNNIFNAHLTAGGSIKANFASRVEMTAQDNIEIKEYIAHSIAFSNQKILLGQDGGKGQVIGGKITAKRGIVLNIAGASASTTTDLVVGYTPEARKEIKELEDQYIASSEKLKHMQYKQEKDLEQQTDSCQEQAEPNKELLDLTKELDFLKNRLEECTLDIVNSQQDGIEIKKNVFTNVFLDINNAKLRISKDACGLTKFIFMEAEIKVDSSTE